MLELKIIAGLEKLTQTAIRLSLKSLNRRDEKALKRFNAETRLADGLRDAAGDLFLLASKKDDEANSTYGRKQREITAAYNYLQNKQN